MKSRPLGVVITRSQEGNEELAKKLKQAGLDPIAVDTITLAPPPSWSRVDHFLRNLASFDWMLFTSSSGVEYFARRMEALSLGLPHEGKPKIAAVGRRTATALSDIGMRADFVPSRYTTSSLGEELPGKKGERTLLLRSEEANPVLAERLTNRGFRVDEAAIYRTLPVGGPGPRLGEADIIVFASPSAVRSFCSLVAGRELGRLRRLRTICIGPVTESAAKEEGFANTSVPGAFTIDALVEEVRRVSQCA